jgi:hypothetical protein
MYYLKGWHCFYSIFKNIVMEQNNRKQGDQEPNQSGKEESNIGNQQGTAQTGAQNAGGSDIHEQDDQYTEDLRQSGDRNSSNRKKSS